jgi:HK97 family phage prohead protease
MARRRTRPVIPTTPKSKAYVATVTDIGLRDGQYEMTVSTANVDRDGDRVMPEGMDAESFKANPALIWSHDYSQIPIGTVTSLTAVKGQGIRARFKFLEGDEFASRVQNAWDQGVVRAASIGFRPKTWDQTDTGYDVTGWELLEISLVAIPANPEAVRTLKALGLITDEQPDGSTDPLPEPASPAQETGMETVVTTTPAPIEDKSVVEPDQTEDLSALSERLTELTTLVKGLSAEPDVLDILIKAGRRNSSADLDLIQKCHDLTKTLGAACNPPEDEDKPPLTAAAISDTVLTLKDMPAPPPQTFHIEAETVDAVLRETIHAEMKALVAAAISQARGRLD